MTTTSTRTPLIAGNWKMNLDHLQAIALVQKLSWILKDAKHDYSNAEVAVFPPFTDLRSVQTLLAADKLQLTLGAQDASQHSSGAYTGDISATFLQRLAVKYVILGHSERRQGHAETDEIIAAKVQAVSASGMIPLICVGETAQDRKESGAAAVPVNQLRAALSTLPQNTEYVVAYEPVWAIGSGSAATAAEAEEVCAALRTACEELRGAEDAQRTRILYGGSVTSENIAGFMREANVDGALVGGASLNAEEFSRIVQFGKHLTAS